MNFHLWSLLAFLSDVCSPCVRPADPESDLPEPLYHAVVSEMAEALADIRAVEHGAADWAAWSAELMTSEDGR